jgi:hypothetical protein
MSLLKSMSLDSWLLICASLFGLWGASGAVVPSIIGTTLAFVVLVRQISSSHRLSKHKDIVVVHHHWIHNEKDEYKPATCTITPLEHGLDLPVTAALLPLPTDGYCPSFNIDYSDNGNVIITRSTYDTMQPYRPFVVRITHRKT